MGKSRRFIKPTRPLPEYLTCRDPDCSIYVDAADYGQRCGGSPKGGKLGCGKKFCERHRFDPIGKKVPAGLCWGCMSKNGLR